MSYTIPKTASSKDIQKNYRSLFDDVISTKEPLLVFNRNIPEVVVIDIKTFEILSQKSEKYEEEMAKQAIEIACKEKMEGKLKELNSLADLI